MLNFLYCFDNNYSIQALTSINSLLGKVSEKINLYIILKDYEDSKLINKHVGDNEMLNSINFYTYKDENHKFPRLKNSHVSEATYYRIFMDNYLPKELDYVTYLDADIICMTNPTIELNKIISTMKKENFILGAKNEDTRKEAPIIFDALNLKNDNYFNAGVIIIDYQNWINDNISSKLIKIMENKFDDIIFWDQDVLNIYYDDNFMKLSNKFNFNLSPTGNDTNLFNEINKDVIFLHYSGKGKPWDVDNIIYENSAFYQNEYRKLNLDNYHIEFKNKKKTIKNFLRILFKQEYYKLEDKNSYLRISMKKLFNL